MYKNFILYIKNILKTCYNCVNKYFFSRKWYVFMKLQRLMSLTRKAVDDYNMIEEGDKIAVGISGGKDSLALLYALAGLRRFYPKKFTLEAITVDLGFQGFDLTEITALCKELDVPYTIVKTDIGEVIFNTREETNPCSLCAKMRKGAFNEEAKRLGCNKSAYAHHRDDVIETMLMSLIYEGRFYTFAPVTYLDRMDITLIRPLIYVNEADVVGFKALIEEYMNWLTYGEESNVSNIDFIFGNIIVKDDIWQVIDYEWTYEKFVPARDIAFRAFYNYMLGSPSRKVCEELLYQDILGLTDAEITEYIEEEREFQKFITGKRAAVGDMRELIGCPAYSLEEIEMYMTKGDLKYSTQLFWDYGEGFKGENSIILNESAQSGASMNHMVLLPENIKQVRIDPCSFACAVTIKSIRVDGKVYTREETFANGDWIDERSVIFGTEDPNIIISCEGGRELGFEMEIVEMPEEMVRQMIQNNQKKDEQLSMALQKANEPWWRKLFP